MGLFKDIQTDLELASVRMVTEYRDRLLVEAFRLCGNQADAEDLVGSVFKEVFAHKGGYDPEKGELYSYLSGILSHLYARSKRRAVNRGTVAVDPSVLAEDESLATSCTDDEIFSHSDHDALRAAIQRLPSDYRDAVLLHYFSELPIVRVARILGISDGTVKWRLSMARKALADDLGRGLSGLKKPLAVLAAVLFGVTALFGAYQAGLLGKVEKVERGEPSASASQGGAAVPAAQNEEVLSNDSQETTTQQANATQTQEKPTMKLTQTFAAAALAVTAAVVTAEADGVTLKVDQVKQRYPWNGLVDIDYTVTYGTDAALGLDDSLEVMMVDHDVTPAVTNRAIAFLQAPLPLTEGSHRITWDANYDGVTSRVDKAEFVLKIAHYSAVYMVIDVSGGPTTNCYPVDFLNGAPPNGFMDDEYKGDKIVLRRIRPGSYMAGSPANEANRTAAREKQHRVAISKPFYIGVFEITQQQYMNVMGGTNPSGAQGENWQYRPVENVSYNKVRGGNWPAETAPEGTTFMGKLLSKCRARDGEGNYTNVVTGIDLPTEFQWEYACRAGTTKAFNTTNDFNNASSDEQAAQLKLLGRYKDNQSDGKGGFKSGHTTVGSYLPNGWGLYDMHGNVCEWCRDRIQADVEALQQYVDPKGAESEKNYITRGGSFSQTIESCRSACRSGGPGTDKYNNAGFRLSRSLP